MQTNGLSFFCHDMRETFRQNYFDYAFNFFTSFGYFDTHEEHQLAISAMAANLKENGTLVIDYLNVGLIEETNGNDSMIQMDHLIFHTKKWQDDLYLFKEIKVVDAVSHEVLGVFEERVRKYNLNDFVIQYSLVQSVHFPEYSFMVSSKLTQTRPFILLVFFSDIKVK